MAGGFDKLKPLTIGQSLDDADVVQQSPTVVERVQQRADRGRIDVKADSRRRRSPPFERS
jgi:hypothetical protein